jgi:hypothetical protein
MTEAEILAGIATIERALTSTAAATRHGETEQRSRSVDDLLKAKAALEALLDAAQDTTARVRTLRLHSRDGW